MASGALMGWYVAGPLALKSAKSFSGIPGQFAVNSKQGSDLFFANHAVVPAVVSSSVGGADNMSAGRQRAECTRSLNRRFIQDLAPEPASRFPR